MKICKVLSAFCFIVSVFYTGVIIDTILDPDVYFGSNLVALFWFSIVVIALFLGLFLMTRGESGERKVKIIRYTTFVMLAMYLVGLVGVLFGAIDVTRVGGNTTDYSLIPFRTIREFWHAYRTGALSNEIIVRNLIGNIVLFMPMSWFLPILFEALRNKWLYALTLLGGICLVEVVQHISYRGVMDVDDVILNFAGAMVVFLFIWNRRGIGFLTEHDIIEDSLF